MGYNSHILS